MKDKVNLLIQEINKISSEIIIKITKNKSFTKEKAFKFPASKAEQFVANHPKQIVNKMGNIYEVHFEIEKC